MRRKSHIWEGKKKKEVWVLTLSHLSFLSPWQTHPLTNQNLQHCHLKISFLIGALVSAGVELVFFLVATMVLSSGFRIWIMPITHQCCSCCWTVPSTFWLLTLPERSWRCKRSQDSWSRMTKGISHTTWHCAQQEEGDIFEVILFVFTINCYAWWALLF